MRCLNSAESAEGAEVQFTTSAGKQETKKAEKVLVAVGRAPRTSDIGLEANFFDHRLYAEVDYYIKETQDAIFQIPILGSLGTEGSVLEGLPGSLSVLWYVGTNGTHVLLRNSPLPKVEQQKVGGRDEMSDVQQRGGLRRRWDDGKRCRGHVGAFWYTASNEERVGEHVDLENGGKGLTKEKVTKYTMSVILNACIVADSIN